MQPIPTDAQSRQRRVALSIGEIALITDALRPATMGSALALLQRLDAIIAEEMDPGHRAIVDAYRAAFPVQDGVSEMDSDAEVSLGDDPGACVMGWIWVDSVDAGICTECGLPGADNGEGYDGNCGDCADAAEAEEE